MRVPPDNLPDSFHVSSLEALRLESGKPCLEFHRRASMSAGRHVLEAGATDGQRSHAEDEACYTASGRARLTVGEAEQAIGPGAFISVPQHVPHHFHSIEERRVLRVLFAPAESGG